MRPFLSSLCFFFNDTATTEIYTLSLHDALPISPPAGPLAARRPGAGADRSRHGAGEDRKSTRLNSSHGYISYAVFCLKKKKNITMDEGNSSCSCPTIGLAPVCNSFTRFYFVRSS